MQTARRYKDVRQYYILKYGPTQGVIKFRAYLARKRLPPPVKKHTQQPTGSPKSVGVITPHARANAKVQYVYNLTLKKKTHRRNLFVI